ncbi:MAG: HD domain-containing protein [Desulfatiglandaceae bacterium]
MESGYIPWLNTRFRDYVERFSSSDAVVQENIDLKAEHTYKVREEILDIGRSLGLAEEDLWLAEAIALLHDIGRFEQYSRYRTFADHKSEDHGALGVRVIQGEGLVDGLEVEEADIILRTVGAHNRADLPVEANGRCVFFLKLLRDADKVDILRVVTEYYQNSENRRKRSLELGLSDDDRVSDNVYDALMNGRVARMKDLETLNDFKLLQIGWVYDLNFPRTFQLVRERDYLPKIRGALPRDSVQIDRIYDRAFQHLAGGEESFKAYEHIS